MKAILHGPRQMEDLVNRPFNEWAKLTFFDLPLYTIDEFNILENKGNEKMSASLRKSMEWFFDILQVAQLMGMRYGFTHKLISEKLVGFAGTKLDKNMSEILEVNVRSWAKYTLSYFTKFF